MLDEALVVNTFFSADAYYDHFAHFSVENRRIMRREEEVARRKKKKRTGRSKEKRRRRKGK